MDETTEIGVGSRLRSRRLELGATITEISEKTRIRRVYLEQIEADQFDKLPGTAYLYGFIRSYAKALQMPAEPLLEILQQHPELVKTESSEKSAVTHWIAHEEKNASLRRWFYFCLGFGFVLLVAGGVYWTLNLSQQGASNGTTPEMSSAHSAAPVEGPVAAPSESVPGAPSRETHPAAAPEPSSPKQ